MSNVATAAFEDLELDVSDMMTNPESFAKRVYEKAEELKGLLKTDQSLATLRKGYEDSSKEVDVKFFPYVNDLFEFAEQSPIEEMPDIIKKAEQLVKDLKSLFEERIKDEIANNSNDLIDKRRTFLQYSELRDKFNSYVDFMNPFMGFNFKALPSLPGNYGSGVVSLGKQFVFVLPNGDRFYNFDIASRKMSLGHFKTFSDFVEYVEAHPECGVQIKEVN